jgi:hypothetical protein
MVKAVWVSRPLLLVLALSCGVGATPRPWRCGTFVIMFLLWALAAWWLSLV